MTKNPFSFSVLAFESQHADPNFVTLVAVASFLFVFIVVLLCALVQQRRLLSEQGWMRGRAGYRKGMRDTVIAIVVVFVVLAVPFGGYLYANVNAIKKDRVDELVDPIVATKLNECVKINSPRPANAAKDLHDWCNHQLEIFGGYKNELIECFSESGSDGRKICLNYWNEARNEIFLRETYSEFLSSGSCNERFANTSKIEKLVRFCPDYGAEWRSIDPCGVRGSCNKPVFDRQDYSDVTEEDIQASLDDGPCYGDCTDMDNDGRTWDDVDADGDGRFEP